MLLVVVNIANCYSATNDSANCGNLSFDRLNFRYKICFFLVCGSRMEQLNGESDGTLDQNPWTVGVFLGKHGKFFICSGNLVSNRHVLVSGVCVGEALWARKELSAHIQIQLGDMVNPVKRYVRSLYRHDSYDNILSFPQFNIGIIQNIKLDL